MNYIVDVCSKDEEEDVQDWHKICVEALKVFQSKCDDIESGKVTANELDQVIKPGEKQMFEIADIISSSSLSSKVKCPKSDQLRLLIQKRITEYEYFSEVQRKMGLLIGKFASKGIQGIVID